MNAREAAGNSGTVEEVEETEAAEMTETVPSPLLAAKISPFAAS